MRRLLVLLLSLATVLAGASVLAGAGPANAQVPQDDPRLGLVYDGLQRAETNPLCGGAFESVLAGAAPWMKQVLCTHGPDPAPPGVDVREQRAPDPVDAQATGSDPGAVTAAAGSVPCYGTGSDGYRVQLLYAHAAGSADRYAQYASSFVSWAGRLDDVVNQSAAETGGVRHVRFVTDSTCNPIVQDVTLTASGMSNFTNMVTELHNQGFTRTDRKYLVWSDTNVYCGISELYVDDSFNPAPGVNYNNGNSFIQGSIGRVDNGCWAQQYMVEAHELIHLLGGVQTSAPNATPGFHCTDESDRLCYADGSTSAPMRQICPPAHEAFYDCNHDDYFSTAPPPGNYLATHWNTASSAFLSATGSAPPPTTIPPPTTTVPPVTTTVPPVTTTVPPVTTTVPPTTTTTPAPTTTAPPPPTTTATTLPPGGAVPSAPQGVRATQPLVGNGIQLSWSAPATGPVTGYRIYRGTTPYVLSLLASVGNVNGYTDVTAGRAAYYYRITAVNGAGEGPASSLVAMVGKVATSNGIVQENPDRSMMISPTQLGSPFAWRWS